MNLKTFLFALIIATGATTAIAGSGHDHGHGHAHEPVTQEQAEQSASRVITTLVSKGVIDSSWDGSPVVKTEQKTFKGSPEWVVSYQNDAIDDPEKRTLYIFLTPDGQYIAANYTGE